MDPHVDSIPTDAEHNRRISYFHLQLDHFAEGHDQEEPRWEKKSTVEAEFDNKNYDANEKAFGDRRRQNERS